ncbi:hypothetical protein ACSQ67_016415 [Phaseolus vulgaris]
MVVSVGSAEASGVLTVQPATTVLAGVLRLRGLPRKGGGLAKGNQEGRAGPSRTTSEPTLLTVGMEVAAHLQVEPTAEDNEVFSTIPTTRPMVETLELQSRALIASRTVVEELERVTTVTVPRLKKDVTEATKAAKATTEMAEKLKAQVEENRAAVKAQEGLTKNLEAQLKEGADRRRRRKRKWPNGVPEPYNSTVAARLGRRRIPINTTFYWGHKVDILFRCWPGDSAAMYAVALLLVFFMAVLVEWLSFTNIVKLKPGGSNDVVGGLLKTGLYGVRSGLSYLVMLAVMSFNGGVFVVAISGHVIGFLIFGTRALRKKSSGLDSSKP